MQATNGQNGDRLLEVKDLRIAFRSDEGLVRAVEGVNFTVHRGQTLGIVGESGSGKSVSTKAIMKLLPRNAIIDKESSIQLFRPDGQSVEITRLRTNGREIRRIRGGEVAMIFQEPMASFSPVYTIGSHIVEAVRHHRSVTKLEAEQAAIELLGKVGIANPEQRFKQYPFELSGGMRQRAMIAVALSTNPALLIADEPTTALDVTIQAQILALLKSLQAELHMATIFITHNLGVIAQMADEVAVMYLGRILEQGPARAVIFNAKHPYTQSLLKAIPRLDNQSARLTAIGGDIPSPLNRPTGCPFHTRCPDKIEGRCDVALPAGAVVGPRHTVDCFLYEAGD
ncbi:MAG: ABC transporter ATP-binding protein [Caldilineaceae bacterium]